MSNNRNYGLDALRSVAIIAVLIGHGQGFLHTYKIRGVITAPSILGVELFYALSGFFIGQILLDIQSRANKTKSVGIFLLRRWMRTLPLYYCVLALLIFIPQLDNLGRSDTWHYLTLTQNLAVAMPTAWYGVSWSLVIEEWSYILLPALAFGIFWRTERPVLMAALVMCAAGWLARIFFTDNHTVWDEGIRKVALMRMDAISYGVMLACASQHFGHSVVKRHALKLLPVSLVTIAVTWALWALNHQNILQVTWASLNGPYVRIFMLPLTTIAMCCFLPLAADFKPHGKYADIIRYIAKISYSLYLVHWPWLFVLGQVPKPFQFVIFIGGSFVSAALLSYLIEQPIMKMRPRIYLARQPHGTPVHS